MSIPADGYRQGGCLTHWFLFSSLCFLEWSFHVPISTFYIPLLFPFFLFFSDDVSSLLLFPAFILFYIPYTPTIFQQEKNKMCQKKSVRTRCVFMNSCRTQSRSMNTYIRRKIGAHSTGADGRLPSPPPPRIKVIIHHRQVDIKLPLPDRRLHIKIQVKVPTHRTSRIGTSPAHLRHHPTTTSLGPTPARTPTRIFTPRTRSDGTEQPITTRPLLVTHPCTDVFKPRQGITSDDTESRFER